MAQNFQPIAGSLLSRQYVVILTSQKQSKGNENRDTQWYATGPPKVSVCESNKKVVNSNTLHLSTPLYCKS